MNQAARAENDDADESEAVNEAKGLYRAGNSIKRCIKGERISYLFELALLDIHSTYIDIRVRSNLLLLIRHLGIKIVS